MELPEGIHEGNAIEYLHFRLDGDAFWNGEAVFRRRLLEDGPSHPAWGDYCRARKKAIDEVTGILWEFVIPYAQSMGMDVRPLTGFIRVLKAERPHAPNARDEIIDILDSVIAARQTRKAKRPQQNLEANEARTASLAVRAAEILTAGSNSAGTTDTKTDTKKNLPKSDRVWKGIRAVNLHRERVAQGKSPHCNINAILSEHLSEPVESKAVNSLARSVRRYPHLLADDPTEAADN